MSAILERLAAPLTLEASTAWTKKQQDPYSQKDKGNAEGPKTRRPKPDAEKRP